jgi:hypothetical protein
VFVLPMSAVSSMARSLARGPERDLAAPHGDGAWYRSYPDLSLNSPAQLGLVPASLLRIAEIHDRRGEQREARAAREKFVRMWRNADPELQPIVEAARAKIAGRSG